MSLAALKPVKLVAIRDDGHYADAVWVPSETRVEFVGTVRQAKPTDMAMLPEGYDRNGFALTLYTSFPLSTVRPEDMETGPEPAFTDGKRVIGADDTGGYPTRNRADRVRVPMPPFDRSEFDVFEFNAAGLLAHGHEARVARRFLLVERKPKG